MKKTLSLRTCLSLILALAIMLALPFAALAQDLQSGSSAPTTTAVISPIPNAAGWNDGPVVVTLRAVDGGSGAGIKQITYSATGARLIDSTTVSGSSASVAIDPAYPAGTTTLTFYAEDNAGNVEAPKTLDVNIDMCYPIFYGDPVTPANANGWYNSDVTIHWTMIDDVSGPDPSTLPADSVIAGEGDNLSAGPVTASDLAGHWTSTSVYGIKIDRTAPVVTLGTPDAPFGSGGWVNGDVTIPFTATDELSGIDYANSDASPFVLSGEGVGVNGTITVRDRAGNIASVATPAFDVDKTGPKIAVAAPVEGATYYLNEVVNADYTATDGLSGVASVSGSVDNGSAIDTSSRGPKSFTVTAADAAGNTSTKTVNYNVVYKINPLYDVQSPFKAGSNAQIKLQLTDANGANMSSPDIIVSATGVDPAPAAPLAKGRKSLVVFTGENFRYRANLGDTGGYICNLSTKGLAPGSYQLVLTVGGDPTLYSVPFILR